MISTHRAAPVLAWWLLVCCLTAERASCTGKNGGGALIVHTDDAASYTSGVCEQSGAYDPGSCEAAGTRTDKDVDGPALIWLIAAFHGTSSPSVSVIYFGLDHNLPLGWGAFASARPCGPAGVLEIPDPGWPDQGGNSVAFWPPVEDTFFPFYVLSVFGAPGSRLGTGINPTGGYACFVDDSGPPFLDVVTSFGTVRWGEAGSNACPTPPIQGACCLGEDATCIITFEGDCVTGGGVYLGEGSICGAPCGPCCYWGAQDGQWFRRCVVTTESDCLDVNRWNAHAENDGCNTVGADFGAPGIICTNDPELAGVRWYCQDPRLDCTTTTQSASWGRLKILFR